MGTSGNSHPGDLSKPRTQRLANARKAAGWLGHVIAGQVIAYFVRHWLP